MIKSVTKGAVINNTYNAAGYRVAKEVSKNGRATETYFLYDGNHVIMEADKDGITAKNTYGGPLLLRTVFHEDGSEETYQYLYNAHGDVVTLLSDGEVAATYCYDSFGNIESQTGEVDNSVLYAGYQYDEETGLYYINARMYDPVTAQFLQRDTYAGTMYDPLSLNLYTYCLNNPHKYVDPTGHFVITAALILMAVRIGISVVSGVVSAKAEYDRQVAEGDNYTNWGSVIFVGVANAGISFVTFGLGQGAAVAAGAGAKAVLKHVGKAVIRDVALAP
ncbi:MAG: RHS repeat-associated core domain-containing protein [Lachnospiraceae bacterium]|nr:RHS repeat-associated core domain-containing protein [Lachnospiraceae bacterium]